MDKDRLDQQNMSSANSSDADATQRLPMHNVRAPRPAAAPRSGAAAAQRRREKEKQRRNLIILICAAALLLVGIVIAAIAIFTGGPENDRILRNVYAAGVNLGGMTIDEAKDALHKATDNTYSKLPMVVTIVDETLSLSPEETGAKLDVDGIVKAAYDRGRTGSRSEQQQARNQALTTAYHVPVAPYLTLNSEYVRQQLNEIGKLFNTTLTQSTYEITGDAPSMDLEEKDPSVVYQTLKLHIGTAEYGLNIDKVYNQIVEAYGRNIFQVTGECSVVAPDALNLEEIFTLYCKAPKNAELVDPEGYQIIPEEYGYGFDLESLQIMVSGTKFGTTLEIPMKFIRPEVTAEDLSGDALKDTLASFRTPLSANEDYNRNLMLAINALNNYIIRPDETFSFNTVIGQPTLAGGYKTVKTYVGKELKDVVGGGISQVASTLYYCALVADLQIVERTNHYYVPSYCEAGMDADVSFGNFDLQFTNTTGAPIRIEATSADGYIEIVLIGTASKEIRVEIETEIYKTYEPITVYITLPHDNAGGYKAGDILVKAMPGYTIKTYRCVYQLPPEVDPDDPDATPIDPDAEPIDPNKIVSRDEIASSYYEKQNQLVVKISGGETPDVPDTSESLDPSESIDPSENA